MTLKTWKAGIADETWKALIVARDLYRAEEAIDHIGYILFENVSREIGDDRRKTILRKISETSGLVLAEKLQDYLRSSVNSLGNAVKKANPTP